MYTRLLVLLCLTAQPESPPTAPAPPCASTQQAQASGVPQTQPRPTPTKRAPRHSASPPPPAVEIISSPDSLILTVRSPGLPPVVVKKYTPERVPYSPPPAPAPGWIRWIAESLPNLLAALLHDACRFWWGLLFPGGFLIYWQVRRSRARAVPVAPPTVSGITPVGGAGK